MITGAKKIKLTVENVLKRISEYDVFKYYMGNREWCLNTACLSPFRDEQHPSFIIGSQNGYMTFIDFGDSSKRGDCFTFVKMLYNLSNMNEVLMMIDRDFGLGILPEHATGEFKEIKAAYKQPEDELGKHYSVIQAITRPFTKEELNYWNDFYQDITDLRQEHVYSISKVYLNRKLFPLKDTELRFGYLYEGKWKIYRPFGGKKSKWVPNNVPITAMDGKECIQNCDTAFITKSKKDYLVLRKILSCTCAVQNEGVACFSKENVEYLKANSNKQILGFDSDVPGVTNSQQITKLFNFDYCNVPREYLPDINDFAEWARVKGLKTIEEYFIKKGIL
jgi:hypothetical protein